MNESKQCNRAVRALRRVVWVYLILLALFTSLSIAVHTIPRSAIRQNVERSFATIAQEDVYPTMRSIDGTVGLDNFTDLYMLNVAFCADASHPVDAAMRNYRYRGHISMITSMQQLLDDKLVERFIHYGKYWHGYQVTLRPLLTVMDYAHIRLLNGILLGVLLLTALTLLWWRVSAAVAVCLVVAMFMVQSSVVPWSLQFSTCYYITLSSVIAMLAWPSLTSTCTRRIAFFFAIGSCTAFLDFFTTPMMTMGVPLTVLLLKRGEKVTLRTLLTLSLAWMAGYALMWASKWLVAYLLVGYNPMVEVTESMHQHSVGVDDQPLWQLWLQVIKYWFRPSLHNLLKFGLLAALACAAWMASRGRQAVHHAHWLLLIAAIPFVWFVVVAHHSCTHYFITMREYLVSWFAILCFFSQIIHPDKLKSYVPFKRK